MTTENSEIKSIKVKYIVDNFKKMAETVLSSSGIKDPSSPTENEIFMLAVREKKFRNRNNKNILAPMTVRNTEDDIFEWLKTQFAELSRIAENPDLYDDMSEDAEFLFDHIIEEYISICMYQNRDESCYKMELPPELVQEMNDEIETACRDCESAHSIWSRDLVSNVIRNSYEDVRCWINDSSAPYPRTEFVINEGSVSVKFKVAS